MRPSGTSRPEPRAVAAAARVILIHGNGGCTAADFWLPYVERELTALGLAVVNQTFPDNLHARARVWLPHLESLGTDEHTILIGHSSGAVAAMRYAEHHRLLGSILVGVSHTDLGDSGEAASGYFRERWQWPRIRDNQQWIAIYNSTDDPHIPIAEPRFVAARLGCRYFEFTDRGHFTAGELPEVVHFLRRELRL
ncbi:MAG: alpha/beta hydrolase [Acidobacteria bacterium]|nr:alpha/beta hydrolase [Acidobacteriota bacterium]